ncbi:MAG: hypothetical protein AAB599_01355 [Patescibacteria group bacterium]
MIQFVILLKFLVPVLLLWFPFQAVWGNYFLDVIDGDILLELGLSDPTYQTIDKVADWFSYVFMLILGLRWRIKKTIVALFVYRTIGQFLYFKTGNELMFFYFQNFLEPLVMVYSLILFKQGNEEKAYKTYKKHFILVWGIILAYKLWNEWYLHFANIDLSTFFFGVSGGR